MNQKPKSKIVGSITITIFDNDKVKTKERVEDGYEKQFASILSAMAAGSLPELILKDMEKLSVTDEQKNQTNMITLMYDEINKRLIEQITKQYKKGKPMVKPTDLFGKGLKKHRGIK